MTAGWKGRGHCTKRDKIKTKTSLPGENKEIGFLGHCHKQLRLYLFILYRKVKALGAPDLGTLVTSIKIVLMVCLI